MDNTLLLNLPSEYRIREIIFVNSGSNYYVKLPVDTHAALLSGNNKGKTSTLSALKLFLLPEINFKKSADKFGFSSGGQYFSDLDTFQYYFPGTESYIICNAENPAWREGFCWVLFRTVELGYQRIAVPHPYSHIEHLFWDDSSSHNNSVGQLQTNISVTEIRNKLLSKEYGGELFTERSTIGEAIYTRTSTADDHTRFCLLPMSRRFTTASVDTVRALLGMAFSLGNASTSSLPMAIGSIIDGMGLSVVKDDGVFIDLDAALDEWKRLKQEDERLSLIEMLTPAWTQLKTDLALYDERRAYTQEKFAMVERTVARELENLQLKLAQANKNVDTTERDLNATRKRLEESRSQQMRCNADLKAEQKQLTAMLSKLNTINTLRQDFASLCPTDDTSDDAIVQVIKGQIYGLEQEIQYLNDQSVAQEQMQTLIQQNNKIKDDIEKLNDSLTHLDSGNTFLDQFKPHTRSVLLSLNESFGKISYCPSDNERHAIESFTELFSEAHGLLTLSNVALPEVLFRTSDSTALKQSLQKSISEKKSQLQNNTFQLGRLHQSVKLNSQERADRISVCKANLTTLQQNISLLLGYAMLQKDYDKRSIELVVLQEADTNASVHFETLSEQFKQVSDKFTQAKRLVNDLSGPKAVADELWRALENLIYRSQEVLTLSRFQAATLDNETLYDPSSIRIALTSISDSLRETHAARDNALMHLKELLDKKLIESTPEDRHKITLSHKMFYEYFNALDTLFSTQEKARESYLEQLHAHNNTAATSARIIENVKGIIENFIDGINQELSTYQISNLDGVEMVADLHPQYVAAVESMRRVSATSDALLSEVFYTHIRVFQDNFYVRRTGKIDLSRIIEKISYRFDRNGVKETIPQSNGTNCMVNAVLLALLLKRMVPEDLQLSMPVIFDEVGSLDENNLSEILKVMDEHGLTLFAANPDATGIIASVLDVYHDLSCFPATDVDVQGKAELIYFPGMEERLTDIPHDSDSISSVHVAPVAG
ncbi:hypothetical protein Pcaca04_13620 [Pectobacterium carotovorum subsp. carotovorum]|nr:hypothetical protein Pcaca04_13620 [Pectobacterium carotovorum subsp. carotovorum]